MNPTTPPSVIPNQTTPPPSVVAQTPKWKQLFSSKKKIVGIIGVMVLVVIVGVLLFSYKNNSAQTPDSFLNSSNNSKNNPNTVGSNINGGPNDLNKPEGSIARAGKEYIFQRDLDYELTFQPGEHTEELKKTLLNKLVKDSITLQAAEQEKLLTLTESEFNIEAKDYQKRIADLKAIQAQKNSSFDQINGKMVSVWFYNYKPAKIGLEKGKQEAFKRITELQTKVASNQITIDQAGEMIIKDPSYANLDFGYVNNALYEFNLPKGKSITFDKGLDELLWKTNQGAVTPVYLAKNVNEFTNQEVEAYYVFGQITKKIETGNSQNYEAWLNGQKDKYEVVEF